MFYDSKTQQIKFTDWQSGWKSFFQYPKDEKLRWFWSNPVVLNLCINLVITKYKKSTIETDSIITLKCELFQSEFSVLSGRLIKNIFPLHICRPNDYTIETIVLLQIQFKNIFSNVLSNIFTRFHQHFKDLWTT